MAEVTANDIDQYGEYLKSHGHDPKDVEDYTAYLKQAHGTDNAPDESFVGKHRGAIEGALNALPAAGAIGGGVLGSAAGPLGGVAGAGAGGMGGTALKDLGEKYILGKDQSRPEYYGGLAKGAAEGSASEAGGQLIGAGIKGLLGRGVEESAKAPAVRAAASRMNVEPTNGMTSNSYLERNLENSLSQNPTIAGALIRKEQEPVYSAIQDTARGLTDEGTKTSPYQAGRDMKGQLIQDLAERHAPISQVYDELKQSTPYIDVAENSRNRIAKNLLSNAEQSTLPDTRESKLAQGLATKIQGADTVDKILQLQSMAKKIAADPNASVLEKDIASDAIDRTQRLYQNSIMRQAIQSARTPGEGQDVAKGLIGDIKDANTQYRGLMQDTNTLGEGSGLFTPKRGKGIGGITNEINKTPNEDVSKAVFDTNNNDYLDFLKDKHPDVYAQARTQKIGEIADKSINPQGEIDPKKFLTSIKNLTPEARAHLFGEESAQKIDDMQTLLRSTPPKIGGSDTPRGLAFQHMLNPYEQATDLAKYVFLKAGIPAAKNQTVRDLGGRFGGRGLLNVTQGAAGLLGGNH
jgi:hypothetical protein